MYSTYGITMVLRPTTTPCSALQQIEKEQTCLRKNERTKRNIITSQAGRYSVLSKQLVYYCLSIKLTIPKQKELRGVMEKFTY